jgi:hypothetical protein
MHQLAFDEGISIAALVHERTAPECFPVSRDWQWLREQAMPLIEARIPAGCSAGRIGLLRAIALCGVLVGWRRLASGDTPPH